MASILHKDRLALAIASFNNETGKWKLMIEISHRFYPCDEFISREAAESFGLEFATAYIDSRTEVKSSAASAATDNTSISPGNLSQSG
jgi:hypothetical protein